MIFFVRYPVNRITGVISFPSRSWQIFLTIGASFPKTALGPTHKKKSCEKMIDIFSQLLFESAEL